MQRIEERPSREAASSLHGAPAREPVAPDTHVLGGAPCPADGPLLLVARPRACRDLLPALRERRPDLEPCPALPDRTALAAALGSLRRGGAVLWSLPEGDDRERILRLLARAAGGRVLPLAALPRPRIGAPVGRRRTRAAHLADHLDLRLALLELGGGEVARAGHASAGEPIAPPADAELLAREVEGLDPERLLVESGRLRVYCAPAGELAHVLPEIGRLREETFRLVGEGTGRARDLDRFDAHYQHLFVWDARQRELVGAYRLGPSTEILERHGPRGLYNVDLFRVDPALFAQLGPALELGRSFVAPRHQRSHLPLLLLFRGIGAWLDRNPSYRHLFGALSISDAFQESSRYLMQRFLMERAPDAGLRELVRPPHALPRPSDWSAGLDAGLARNLIADLDDLAAAVTDLEEGRRRPPVLMREYLRLGASVLATGVDPDFGNTLDALVLVDLRRADEELLARYLGEDVVRRLRPTWASSAA